MSELLSDILNKQDKYLSLSEKKDNGVSLAMKGRYDFERFLLDNIDTLNDMSAENSANRNTFEKKYEVLKVNNDTAQELFTNDVLHPSKSTIDDFENIYLKNISNDIKSLANIIIKSDKPLYLGLSEKESLKLSRISSHDKYIAKPVQQNNSVVDIENIRLVKSELGYILYVNDDGLNLSSSKLIELLKIIHSDKRVSINKVILNRETIFDKSKPLITESVVDNADDSYLNIRI